MNLQKNSIDLGIIAQDIEAMLAFYRDAVGLAFEATIPFPGGGTMHRFKAGDSIIKIIELEPEPEAHAPGGGIRGATGYRYWTLSVEDLDEVVARIGEAGYRIMVPVTEVRPGVTIAIAADPDGNWVEFLKNT